MLGRVMSLLGVVLIGGMAVGGPIAAFVASVAGPRAPFVLGAFATAAAFAVLSHSGPRVADHLATRGPAPVRR